MQNQKLFALLGLGLAACVAAEGGIGRDDVPAACVADCQAVIDLTTSCDAQNDEDAAERTCVCTSSNVESQFNSCAACMKRNGASSTNDNDVAEWMTHCNFSYADVPATLSATGVVTMPTFSDDLSTATFSATATTGVPTTVTDGSTTFTTTNPATTTGTTTGTNPANSVTSTVSPAAAPVATVGLRGLVAGLALALPALL